MYNKGSTNLYNVLMGNINSGANNAIGRYAGESFSQPKQGGNLFTNALTGFGDNLKNRARAAGNAISTTIAAPISFANDVAQNRTTDYLRMDSKNRMNAVAKKYGYNTYQDIWDARDAAEAAGDTETLNKIDNVINPELQAQAASNAKEMDANAAKYEDYRNNDFLASRINQDQGKFAGDALTTLSTAADIAAMTTGLPMGVAANAVQGGVEGLANELSANGFENFDWGRAGQQAASGALAGAATAGLNKVLGARAAAKAIPTTKAPGFFKTVAQGAGRGALSGAVGGAVGAGTTSALSGQGIGTGLVNTLSGAAQGATSGAFSGGIMGGVNNLGGRAINAIDRKFGTNLGEISQTGAKWQNSGENFDERLTNTLNSGDSAVGNWINGRQSKALGRLGTIGNRIQDVSDQPQFDADELATMIREARKNGLTSQDLLAMAEAYEFDSDGNVKAADIMKLANRPDGRELVGPGQGRAYNKATKDWQDTPTLQQISEYGYDPADVTGDPTTITADGRTYYKIGENKWATRGGNGRGDLGGRYRDDQIAEIVANANDVNVNPKQVATDNRVLTATGTDEQYTFASNDKAPRNIKQAALDYAYETDGRIDPSEFTEFYNAAQKYEGDIHSLAEQYSMETGGRIDPDEFVDFMFQSTGNDYNTGSGIPSQKIWDAGVKALGLKGKELSITSQNQPQKIVDAGMEALGITGNNTRSTNIGDRQSIVDYLEAEAEGIPQTAPAYRAGDAFKEAVSDLRQNYSDAELAQLLRTTNNGKVKSVISAALEQDSPTTASGWLKKAGQRLVDDLNDKGVGLSLKDVSDQYSDDINGMVVNRNDMLDNTAESPETELYRQLTGDIGNNGSTAQTPLRAANTGNSWDNLAREYGYNSYNDAIRAFAAANPNTPISAGAVTTWLDSNEGNYNPNQVQTTQNATMPAEIQEAEIVPSKTSRETKLKYAQGKELLAQYGAVDQPMARATKAPETFQKLAEMGFTKPGDVERISNAITGSNGAVSKLTKSVIASAKPINTFDGKTAGQSMDDFINNSIEHNMLSGTNQGKAVKRGIDAYLRALPSHADGSITMEDSAADAFKVVQGLEARAAELEGRGGSTYHRATTEDVHQAAVLKDVANLLKDRIYAGADVKAALTPEVAQELKAFDPKNTTWAKTVDDFVSSAKTAQDLRTFQKPFVRANRYIDNQYVQASTAGGRMAASAGELPDILPTTKAGIIKQVVNNVWNSNPAHRAKAAVYGKLAENAAAAPQTDQPTASNPQTAVYDLLNRNNTLNIIGREAGLDAGGVNKPTEEYISQASAEQGYVAPLGATTTVAPTTLEGLTATGTIGATTPTTFASALGNNQSAANNTTASATTPNYTYTDIIAGAMERAAAAGDADAFATLYGMYNDAVAELQSQNDNSSNLSATQQTQLAKFDSAEDAINELEGLYNQAGGGKGPIAGNLQSIAGDWGWDSGARTYNQMAEGLVNQIAQAIGKTDSLNTEGEVKRALQLVPSLTDDAQTAQNKLKTLRQMLEQTKANYYNAYGVTY